MVLFDTKAEAFGDLILECLEVVPMARGYAVY
jgi:hypothetical protein